MIGTSLEVLTHHVERHYAGCGADRGVCVVVPCACRGSVLVACVCGTGLYYALDPDKPCVSFRNGGAEPCK